MNPVAQKLNKEDLGICRALRSLVLQGKFDVQGAALVQAGALLRWLDGLEARIAETIKQPPPETIRKDLGKAKK